MFDRYVDINTYQCRIKALKQQLEDLRSGNAMKKLREEYERLLDERDKTIRALEMQLAQAYAQIVHVRELWMQVLDDVEKEHQKQVDALMREIKRLEQRVLDVERQGDEVKDKLCEKIKEYYAVATELEEEKGKNLKLTAQVNRDFMNSSTPSSQQGPARKKIPNSREKTGRRRGGQPGHKGHCLKAQTPTKTYMLPDPQEYVEDPDYYDTGHTVKKQKIILDVNIKVIEYEARIFRNRKTGSRVHADFPEGYVNAVNYDGSVKAFAFLLTNECNVSVGRTCNFLSELSDGKINLSEAAVNGFSEEFSSKTEEEKKDILERLMTSPVLNADFTNANVNGETRQVLIIASPDREAVMYCARQAKGHKGIQGTPLAGYVGTVVHDHDHTFYNYGLRHQECMQHNCRYLIGSMENEPEREWNKKMHELIREMLHYRNGLGESEPLDAAKAAELETRYDEILKGAEKEYADEPPNAYYREGYNLYLRLMEYKESELLFLHDKSVPANNSLAERLARVYKRKQRQATVLRSDDSFEYLCDSLGLIYTLRHTAGNLYKQVSDIFNRKRYRKKRRKAQQESAGVTA